MHTQIDNYNIDEIADLIKKHEIRNPDGDSEVLPPIPFNLMFKTSIGEYVFVSFYLARKSSGSFHI